MSSDLAPLVIGLAAAGLLLVLVGIGIRRPAEWMRARRRQRQHLRNEYETEGEEWVYRPQAPNERAAAPAPTFETVAGAEESIGARDSPSALIAEGAPPTRDLLEALGAELIAVAADGEGARHESELEQERAALEERLKGLDSLVAQREAERRAEELLAAAERPREGLLHESEREAKHKAREITDEPARPEEPELVAKEMAAETGQNRSPLPDELARERSLLEEARTKLDSLRAIQEAAHTAEELLAAAERRHESVLHDSELEAANEAAEITEDARRRARERLAEAELEAKRIVEDANRERYRLVNALAEERGVLEETRLMLARFLADALEEVEGAPAANQAPPTVPDLDDALNVKTHL